MIARSARSIISFVPLFAVLAPSTARSQHVWLSAVVDSGRIELGATRLPARAGAANDELLAALHWRSLRPGLQLAELPLRAGRYGAPVEAVIVRVEPAHYRFALELRTQPNHMTGTWTIDSAPASAALAMNAGQFKETGPWGWLVIDGVERRDPIGAPLGIGIRIDTAGRMHWTSPAHDTARIDGATAFGFQSFPLLLRDGVVPVGIRGPRSIDLGHRDARLVLAETSDGRLLFVLTRFAGLGTVADRVPIGLTTPEALMLILALGAQNAVMLDGGISAQLVVRDSAGTTTRWAGLRKVPLGLIARPREEWRANSDPEH